MDDDRVLWFDAVTKNYGRTTALSEIDFQVDAGERVVLLGHNGAGKTTAVQIALGLARPTTGDVWLFDRWPDSLEARSRLGYSPQTISAPGGLRVRELVRFIADLKGVPEPIDLYSRFQVEGLLHRMIGVLSTGQLRVVTTLLAFIGEPDLLVLDEPTSGLDAEHKYVIWQEVSEYCRAGGTLLLASHDFSEVTQLAQRALLLHEGRLVEDGPVTDIVALSDVTAVEVADTTLSPIPGVLRILHTPTRSIVLTRDPQKVLEVLYDRTDASPLSRQPTLEEVFLTMGAGK